MDTEKRAYLKLLEESFPGMNANIGRWEKLGFTWETSRPFLKEEKGEILSHVGVLDYPLLIDGRSCKVAALHAICTKATHRRQGLASALIHDALKWANEHYEFVILYTESPKFYEKFSFRHIQEYRFRLACSKPMGAQTLVPLVSPKDDALFLRLFQQRAALSNNVWMNDSGAISSFNALFATYPTYWSLHYSASIDGIISYLLQGKTLHLFDVIAPTIPSLEVILDHLPGAIDEIYFYFSPDRLTPAATPEPFLFGKNYFMVHGNWPTVKPFMISPLSRC